MLHKVDPKKFVAASAVSGAAELEKIRLLALNSCFRDIPESAIQQNSIAYGWDTKHIFAEDQNRLTIQVEFTLRSTDTAQTDVTNPTIEIQATYESAYELKVDPPPLDLRDSFFEGFASVGAVQHLWPFWRELVILLTQKFGIEAIVLPLIKFLPNSEEATEVSKKHPKKLPSDKRQTQAIRQSTSQASEPKKKAPKAKG